LAKIQRRRLTIAKRFASTTVSKYPVKVCSSQSHSVPSLRWIGGWDRTTGETPEDISQEVDQAFDNVAHAIQQAGGTDWDQVYKIRIYITVPMDDIAEPIIGNMKERCKNHGPLMTVVQVVALYKTMRIEIEAEAHLGWAILLDGRGVVFMALDYLPISLAPVYLTPRAPRNHSPVYP
jgi:enamine deaminase RidA (YjgF/YER057c/UK114 family)